MRQDTMEKGPQLFYSVEFAVEGVSCRYQFRIRRSGKGRMFILVREDSRIVKRLRVGDTLKMTYYSTASPYPAGSLDTMIRGISRKDRGRFKGHCTVRLDIREPLPAEERRPAFFLTGPGLFSGGEGMDPQRMEE